MNNMIPVSENEEEIKLNPVVNLEFATLNFPGENWITFQADTELEYLRKKCRELEEENQNLRISLEEFTEE